MVAPLVPLICDSVQLPEWVPRLPTIVQTALALPTHPLVRLLPRLDAAARRLQLAPPECVLLGCLLALELDEDIHGMVMANRAAHACTRSDLIHLAGGDAIDALESLAMLEARGIVVAADDGGPWAATAIAIAPAMRGGIWRQRLAVRPATAPRLLSRLERAIAEVVAAAERTAARRLHVVVRGRRGSGRDTLTAALLDRFRAAACVRTPLDLRGAAVSLEPELSGDAAVWDARGGATHADDLALAARFLARGTTLAVSVLDSDDDAPVVSNRVPLVIEADPRDATERNAAWEQALATRLGPPLRDEVAAILSERSRSGSGLAHQVAGVAAVPDTSTAEAWVDALLRQLESSLQPSLLRGVTIEHPEVTRECIVVAASIAERTNHLVAMMRHAARLGTPTRVGVKAMLSGPSGTGKTLTARAIATELGRPLFRVDLATVVSKWVGETEKNLRRAMHAAESAGAILLFDEGDALFGSRGEVTRGADRYANMEVSYLLQALESFDGLAIVTTNLKANVDRAFIRRFDVIIEFQKPDAVLRSALWRQELGIDAAVLAPALFDRIAQAELTGGHIAVACRAARALALDHHRPVTDDDVIRALTAELRAIGSNVAASRWGEGHGG